MAARVPFGMPPARRPPASSDDDDDDDDDDGDDDTTASDDDDDESPTAPADQDGSSSEETDEEGESADEGEDGAGQEHQGRGEAADGVGGEREEREEVEVSPELVALALEALDGDDVSPVVRLAFERAAPNVRGAGGSWVPVLFSRPVSCAQGRRQAATLTRPAAQAVTHALEVIIERKEAEAQSIVAQSYEEFVDSMAELRHVQARTASQLLLSQHHKLVAIRPAHRRTRRT